MSLEAIHLLPLSSELPSARLVVKSLFDGHAFVHLLKSPSILIGRTVQADLQLDAPTVSREHIRIEYLDGNFILKKISQTNRVEVNGRAIDEDVRIKHGDHIFIHPFSITFEQESLAGNTSQHTDAGTSASLKVVEVPATILEQAPTPVLLPRLVLESVKGPPQRFPFGSRPMLIGRAPSCAVVLTDESVSREHARIYQHQNLFYVQNLSDNNRTLVNGRPIKEARLMRGDKLQIGSHMLTFLSERPIDRPQQASRRILYVSFAALAAMLILIFSYVGFVKIVQPWQQEKILKQAEFNVRTKDFIAARFQIDNLFKRFNELELEKIKRAHAVLAEAAVLEINGLIKIREYSAAKKVIRDITQQYGSSAEFNPVIESLDRIRVVYGKTLENFDPKSAMREYIAVQDSSPYYADAQRSISKLWVNYQQQKIRAATHATTGSEISGWLQQAEERFQNKHFLSPVNNNAYTLYRMVLERDPTNPVALERINAIKKFYEHEGEWQCKSGNTALGQTYYSRYLIIEPNANNIRDKFFQCSGVSVAAQPPGDNAITPSPNAVAVATPKDPAELKKQLEKSGPDSEWILQFLFDDKSVDQQQTP